MNIQTPASRATDPNASHDADVSQLGTGSYSASYINWARTMQMLRDKAPGWQKSVDAIKAAIAADDSYTSRECWDEIPDDDKRALWIAPSKGGCFTTAERDYIKNMKAVA